MSRWRAAAGAVGPAVFITAWAVLGARTAGYSPIEDPISRLAAVGAPTRGPMTAALVVYAISVGLFADELERPLGRAVGMAAVVNSVATIGIAITPLDSSLGGAPHAASAAVAYLSLGAMPLLAAAPLTRRGHPALARASAALGLGTLTALALSAADEPRTGLWQRVGLTTGDVFLIGASVWLLRRRGRTPVA